MRLLRRSATRLLTLLLAGASLVGSVSADECDRWRLAYPPSRAGQRVAFDDHRGVFIVFGGARPFDDREPFLRDLWEWNGDRWEERTRDHGPSARAAHAMAFDRTRGMLVVFGGRGLNDNEQTTTFSDTWEWDGADWSLRSTGGPSPRAHAGMTFDDARGVALLYGGDSSPRDLWCWDGSQWTLLHDDGPPDGGMRFAFDSARSVAVLIARREPDHPVFPSPNPDPFVRTWEWDGVNWSLKDTSPVNALPELFTPFYDAVSERVVVPTSASKQARFEWDGVAWQSRSVASSWPTTVFSGTGAANAATGEAFVFSGPPRYFVNSNVGGGLYRLTRDQWETLSDVSTGPGDPFRTRIVHDADRAATLALSSGGVAIAREWAAHTWRELRRPPVEMPPGQRFNPFPQATVDYGAAWDADRSVAVLHGGRTDLGGDFALDETWEFSGLDWRMVSVGGPGKRYGTGMVFDSARAATILFGGSLQVLAGPVISFQRVGDTWSWNGQQWAQVSTDGPTPRNWPALAFDSERHVAVLFGGVSDSGVEGDTWEWDGAQWTRRDVVGPPSRAGAAMVFDTERAVCVLNGGRPYPSEGLPSEHWLRDKWEWDGLQWRKVADDAPLAWGHSMVHDATESSILLFGSLDAPVPGGVPPNSPVARLWRYRPLPRVASEPDHLSLPLGAFINFTPHVRGKTDGVSFQWRHRGAPLSDDGRIVGATTPVLTIKSVHTGDIGDYELEISDACAGQTTLAGSIAVPCFADLSADGAVGPDDLAALLSYWRAPGSPGDFNGDDQVNARDLALLLAAWGPCPSAPEARAPQP